MGKAALLAVAAFIIASSYYNMATQDGHASTARATSEHQLSILARNAAIGGYGQAKQLIADVGTFDAFVGAGVTIDGEYDGATYHATITSDGDLASIESIGEMSNGADEVSFTVTAVIGWEAGPTVGVPPFLTYALLTEQDLNISGNISGSVDDESELNANFHSNGNLHINGNSAQVAGFGTYVGSGTSNPSQALSNTFQPNFNPDELETAYQTEPVDIPEFEVDSFFESVEPDETSPGSVQLTGPVFVGGTADDPYVWHVQGDLTATGGSSIVGYVMFVVDGDINLNGNLTGGGIEDESTVALYAGDDVTINGSVEIHGQIYAAGNVTFTGTPDIHGSVAGGGQAILNGNPAIHYQPPSEALSSIFSEASTLALRSYYER